MLPLKIALPSIPSRACLSAALALYGSRRSIPRFRASLSGDL